MRPSLTMKFVLSYCIFGLIILILLGTFTQNATDKFLLQNEAKKLYREASLITDNLDLPVDSMSLPDMQRELEFIGNYFSCQIWIVDSHGNLLLDSANPNVSLMTMNGFSTPIIGFNIADFSDNYYQTGSFYRSFSQNTLSVFSPITASEKVYGYVLMHAPVVKILENSYEISNFIFYAAMSVYGCSFLILITYLLFVRRPIHKIRAVATKYVKGDFSKKIEFHSNDEMGDLANTMNYMATELNTLEEEQRTFISNVSHDFRSPLTSIKGYTEAMLDGTIPVEMQGKYLNIILFETERLNKLTQSILDLNQFGQKGLHLDITNFDINEVIQSTIPTFEHVCQKKALTFDLNLTEKPLFVKGDMDKIQQVLYNLIDNATKFSHNNTAITIGASIRNGKVLISVKDSGIGIPRDSIKKIWDRFYKTDLSRGKDKRGTGLGLAIVKEIIQAHNENINVISTEGVGTEFIFTLPLSEKEHI